VTLVPGFGETSASYGDVEALLKGEVSLARVRWQAADDGHQAVVASG
jgi:hypothetical protein